MRTYPDQHLSRVDPQTGRFMKADMDERIALHTRRDPETGCLLWTGATNADGYPIMGKKRAHRAIYEHKVGPIPKGFQLDHKKAAGCRSRACVEVDHLEPVTCRENLMRGDTQAAKNVVKTHCSNGHEFSPENTRMSGTSRKCRECTRQATRAWRAKLEAAA